MCLWKNVALEKGDGRAAAVGRGVGVVVLGLKGGASSGKAVACFGLAAERGKGERRRRRRKGKWGGGNRCRILERGTSTRSWRRGVAARTGLRE